MSYILSQRSLNNLKGVHPNLVKVVKRAIEITGQDFMVIEGVRSREQCMINYGKGRTAAQMPSQRHPCSLCSAQSRQGDLAVQSFCVQTLRPKRRIWSCGGHLPLPCGLERP